MPPKPKPGILDIAPYAPGKSKAKAGMRVVKLSSNETPLGASPAAQKAYVDAAATLHRYPDGNAAKLREAIAEIYKLSAEQIVCGAGSDELIGLLIHAYAGAGDEVLISQHGFLMYKIYAQSFGATPVFAAEKNLRTDVDVMLAAVSKRTKIVLIANPNNPTGSYISKAELKKLRGGLPDDVVLAVDGAYTEYALAADYSDGRELVDAGDNTVMLRTFSKIYGLSALRIGWAYAPQNIIDVLNRIRGPFNVSNPAIEAASAAVRDIEFTAHAKKFNDEWLQYLTKEIAALGLKVHPSIANFVLVEFPAGKHSASNANNSMMERGLIPREVANYGLPDCLRISVGLEEDNIAVVKTLAEFLKELMFERITIIGLGLIGSSIARAAHEKKLAKIIVGCDPNPLSLAYGIEHGFIDVAEADAKKSVHESDVIIIAAPPGALKNIARNIAPALKKGAVVMDTASVKAPAIEAIAPQLPAHIIFIPAHPIAGSEHTGAAAGRADLFAGKKIIITPEESELETQLTIARGFWEPMGAKIEAMPTELHDLIYAYVSHLPQMLSFASAPLIKSPKNPGEILQKFLRLSDSSPVLWKEIFELNKANILNGLNRYLDVMHHIKNELLEAPGESDTKPDETLAREVLFPRIAASCLITTVMEAEKKSGAHFSRFAGSGFADFTAPATQAPEEDMEQVSKHYAPVAKILDEYIARLKDLSKTLQ